MTQGFFQFNNTIINETINFVTSSFDLLFMSGSKGSSKGELIEKVMPELEENNLVFRHFCFENTVIDDFLLNFYDALRNFSLVQKISLKKFATDNFKEKVSHYFKTIGANCIIVVENFEKVDENVEIIDFLSHLASYSNVKIIILTRSPDKNLFRFKKVRMQTLDVREINKDEFKSKLTILSEPFEDDLKEKFYEITNGYELYLKMSIRYCTTTNTSIKDLISEFERKNSNSNITFEEFLISKFISLTPSAHQNIFRLLCTLNHPVSISFIDYYKLGNPSHIEYLSKNFLINFFRDEIYVKDYVKQYITKGYSVQERATYCKNFIEIYENELTKSPKDRLLRLSRESIRKEIERFRTNVPSINSSNKNLSYLGIATSGWQEEKNKQKSRLAEKLNKIKERKNFLSATRSDNAPIGIAKSQKFDSIKEKNKQIVIDLINSSREYTKQYLFKEAIVELSKAQVIDSDDEFKIEILILIAKNYEHLNEHSHAQKQYLRALELAIKSGDTRKCEIEFRLALSDKNLFKIESAKEKFNDIIDSPSCSQNYKARANLELGEIEEANSDIKDAIKHYETALNLSMGKNKELVCKSYYKLAVLYDENQDSENAIKYYQKNYTTSSERRENKYYSVSLTNLALIYIEMGKYKEASEYLKLALESDSENNDWENMYFSQKELGKLYSKIDEISAIGYYKQALDSARKLKDLFKEALVYFEAGELYYDKEEDEKALTNFLNAKLILKNNSNDENIARINSRIKDIKMRLENVAFNLIMDKYDRQLEEKNSK